MALLPKPIVHISYKSCMCLIHFHTKKVMIGLPSQFESKSNSKGSKSAGDAEFNKPTSAHNSNDMELDIRVCVERSVVDYKDESEHSSSWVK
ncbi:hypothetical protein BD769DRAFT_1668531 [Suillus cothurnatus]|nr:hypothetical protein BD769DRAFT_1668531 [Suillus cothurnatus]